MKILRRIKEVREYSKFIKISKKSLGFIPTMGNLHEGHFSLVKQSMLECDTTICSIYVNPTQFNNKEDFEKYPKTEESDLSSLKNLKIDAVFLPETEEIYNNENKNIIEMKIPNLMKNLCAPFRPGHFEGVLQIVSKLFNIVQPDISYFGLKDYQQYLIIKSMSENLSFPISIKGLETVREKSGLAMSSRNSRLNSEELEEASIIYRSMNLAKNNIHRKDTTIDTLKNCIKEILLSSKNITIEYIEILDPLDLSPKLTLNGEILIGISVYINGVRLIDNIRLNGKK